jgi:uncharacterized protein (TIGR02246 family)
MRKLAVGLIAVVSAGAQTPEKAAVPAVWDEAQKPIVATVEKYLGAFNKGDVKALEGFFDPNARLTTVDGEIIEGRDAILAMFRDGFAGNPGLTMRSEIRSIRLVAETVAIETGFSYTRTTADPVDDVVAYEVVHVHRDGSWRMFEIFETAPVEDSPKELHVEKLAGLDFLVGEWLEESETATIEHRAEWSPNHRWLLLNFHAEDLAGKPIRVASQRIGWDPRAKSIRSWLFEEDGGHAEGFWTHSDNGRDWTIRANGVLADGRCMASTLKFERVTADRIRIVGYDRTVDGTALPDAPPRYLVRKPQATNAKKLQ